MNGSSATDGSRSGTTVSWPRARMKASSRQTYSLTRSAFSVHDAFV